MKESLIDPAAPLGDPGPETVDQNSLMEVFLQSHGENMPETGGCPVAHGKDQYPAQKSPTGIGSLWPPSHRDLCL